MPDMAQVVSATRTPEMLGSNPRDAATEHSVAEPAILVSRQHWPERMMSTALTFRRRRQCSCICRPPVPHASTASPRTPQMFSGLSLVKTTRMCTHACNHKVHDSPLPETQLKLVMATGKLTLLMRSTNVSLHQAVFLGQVQV